MEKRCGVVDLTRKFILGLRGDEAGRGIERTE